MALANSDRDCRIISPIVVLDQQLDGEELALVRAHLRHCESCRERVEEFREQLLRQGRLERATTAVRGMIGSARRRAPAFGKGVERSRRYALVAVMAALVGGLFVSSSPRLAADAIKQTPTLAVASTQATDDSAATSPSAIAPPATTEPSSLPATSQDLPAPTVAVPYWHPTPAPAPAPTPAPAVPVPPTVKLTVTPLSGLAPLTVTANAAGSWSASGIASYAFDFGNGGGLVPPIRGTTYQSNTYCRGGHYKVTVFVTDKAGLISSAYIYVDVTQPIKPIC